MKYIFIKTKPNKSNKKNLHIYDGKIAFKSCYICFFLNVQVMGFNHQFFKLKNKNKNIN